MLVCYFASSSTGHTITVSDDTNGSYNQDTSGFTSWGIFTFPNNQAIGRPNLTVTTSGAGVMNLFLEEWANVLTVNPFDQHASNSNVTTTTQLTGTTPTLSQANELVLAVVATNTDAAGISAVTPFTGNSLGPIGPGATKIAHAASYQPTATTGLQATFTTTNSVSSRCGIATYKVSSGLPPPGGGIFVIP
jgi:hypothetical protein